MYNKINMDLECNLASSMNRKDEMSGSTSKIICTNGSTTEDNSELNVSNKLLDVEQNDTDQNTDISDTESTVTIGEISADEYYDEIIYGKHPVIREELHSTDQNEQSGSSNYINVVNNDENDNSDGNRENLGAEYLIALDISLALPTITKVHRRIRAQIREQPRHRGGHGRTLEDTVCHRQACNISDIPFTPRNKQRAAAIEAAAKIAKSGTKRKHPNNEKVDTTVYYSCGHREKITGTSLKHIGIKTPMNMKESRLLDQRLMKTNLYLLKVPAALTVDQIINDFRRKANLSEESDLSFDLVFTAFNHAVPAWCLYYIEKIQYNEIIKKYPNRQLSELYGLAHLFRFIMCLPRLYQRMKPDFTEFNVRVTELMNGLMDYLVEENLRVDNENDYEHVMPEYYQLTYGSIENQT
eukprot:XP_008180539.2 PREDICTED: uncharacterized protein LOC100569482 [Acyrthosiphon pisum]